MEIKRCRNKFRVKIMAALDKGRRLLVKEDEVCKRWTEDVKELMGSNDTRDKGLFDVKNLS